MAATGPTTTYRTTSATTSASAPAQRVWLTLLAVVVLCLGLPVSVASAHAQLLGSTPKDGSVVDTAPESVELLFNEDINPAFAQVIVRDHSGSTVASQTPKVDGPKVITQLPALGPGQVTVLFRVTSKDAHPISGKVSFTIDGEPGFAAPAATASTGAANPGSSDGDQQAAGSGSNTPSAASGPPAAWLYVVTSLAALALMGLGAVVLRRERRTRPAGFTASAPSR